MRYVAGYFIVLLDRFGGLATAAYLLVAWIGLKLVVGGLHTGGRIDAEIPGWLFWSVMLAIAVIGLVLPTRSEKAAVQGPGDVAASSDGQAGKSGEQSVKLHP